MNRGLSSDSLDNEQNDMIVRSGSSSATDFTSDDEASTYSNLYMISGQPMNKTKPVLRPNTEYLNFHHQLRTDIDTDSRLDIDHKRNQSTLVDNQIDQSGPSTSWLDYEPPNHTSSRIADVAHGLSIPQALVDRPWQSYRPEREYFQDFMMSEEEKYGPYNKSPSIVESTTGGLNPITVRLCAKLVECRTLNEAMEFVESNRSLIENLIRIVTHEAPAYRDYDMNNYQIDNSVKESFNPNFWLDREPVVTTADGNCQYHAVSISLTGSEMYTPEVRLATAVAVLDNRDYFDSILELIDRGSVLDLVHVIARCYSWGDETTLKAVAVAIKRRIFLYTCNIGKKDYEVVKSLTKEELIDAFKEKKYRGGTGIHTYADPLTHASANNYIILFHKSEHFIAVLPTSQQPTMFEPYNPIVPIFS